MATASRNKAKTIAAVIPIGSSKAHKDEVTALAFSPCGTFLASGSRDASVRLWRSDTVVREQVQYQRTPKWAPHHIAFGPRWGEILMVTFKARDDGSAVFSWDTIANACTLLGGGSGRAQFGVGQPIPAPTGSSVVFCGSPLRRFDVAERTWSAAPFSLEGSCNSAAFSDDGNFFAAATAEGVTVFDAHSRKRVRVQGSEAEATCVACLPQEGKVAFGTAEGQVQLWDYGSDRIGKTWKGDPVSALVPIGGDRLISIHRSGDACSARLLSVKSTEVLAEYTFGEHVSVVAVSTDGRFIAAGESGGTVSVWDLRALLPTP